MFLPPYRGVTQAANSVVVSNNRVAALGAGQTGGGSDVALFRRPSSALASFVPDGTICCFAVRQ